ncbi:hypothetical protein HYN59_11685 [Flavobacterium album]|uniref:Uncharacterized protein n=1 Tax=Flavobacterium album TaxID=2175091 RepID=A0A2S1QZ79_9FLAO|nr:hypothetical protein [Flavobacterium album]AWH85727.1 hypothetical protein HYN59_11685 [Flavobacterium album]
MDQPKKNTENEQLGNPLGKDNGSGRESQRTDNSGSDNLNAGRPGTGDDRSPENDDIDDTDKYLAMEQPGVQYTQDSDPTANSDHMDFSSENGDDEWSEEGGNSKNSDAFNQDDYILNDNVDLDEDQNQSISSDDEDYEESNERYTN